MLIVLRGNSGSGKSTTAKLLREAALKSGSKFKIAIVEQDYLRRFILKEKEAEGSDNIALISETVTFALDRGYAVILEGILYSRRYKKMLRQLADKSAVNYFYYFDVSFDDTLQRHYSKPNAQEFDETQMRQWYIAKDLLGFDNEQIIDQTTPQQQVIEKILESTGL